MSRTVLLIILDIAPFFYKSIDKCVAKNIVLTLGNKVNGFKCVPTDYLLK